MVLPGMVAPEPGFNPSQVGYKPILRNSKPEEEPRFNPSQVGYKPCSTTELLQLARRFNPSQVGYKPHPLGEFDSAGRVSIPHR